MLGWYSAELPQSILNSLVECFERFVETQRDRLEPAILAPSELQTVTSLAANLPG